MSIRPAPKTILRIIAAIGLLTALAVASFAAAPPARASSGPELDLQVGHIGGICGIAFSADGETLATSGEDNTIKTWDVASGQVRRTFHMASTGCVALTRDGETLAGADLDNIDLWDAATGKLKRTIPTVMTVDSLAFSPDATLIAAAIVDTDVTVWNAQTGKPAHELDPKTTAGPIAVGFTADGSTVICVCGDNSVWEYNAQTGALQRSFTNHPNKTSEAVLSPDGSKLVTIDRMGVGKLWSLATGEFIRRIGSADDAVMDVDFSPDSSVLADIDVFSVSICNVQTGTTERKFPTGGADPVSSIAFVPNGGGMLYATLGGSMRLVDDISGATRQTFAGNAYMVNAVAYSPDGSLLASAGEDGSIKLWDAATFHLDRTILLADDPLSVAFSPDGATLAAGDDRGAVHTWKVRTGAPIHNISAETYDVTSVVYSPDGSLLATLDNGGITLRDPVTGHLKRRIAAGGLDVIAFLNGDEQIAGAAMGSESYQVWDSRTGGSLGMRHGVLAPASAWSPNRASVLDLFDDLDENNIQVVDSKTRSVLRTLTGHTSMVDSAVYRPGGNAIASSSYDGSVKVWNAKTGKLLATVYSLPPTAVPPQSPHGAGKGILIGDKGILVGDKAINSAYEQWFVLTPEGYFDCSAGASAYVRWIVDDQVVPAARYMKVYYRPDLVRKALAGETIEAPAFVDDPGPTATLSAQPVTGGSVTVDIDVTSSVPLPLTPDAVQYSINGRAVPQSDFTIVPDGRTPIAVGDKRITPVMSPSGTPSQPLGTHIEAVLPVPAGEKQITVTATAYDANDIGSDPVSIVLQGASAPTAGDLYVVAVGVDKYLHADGTHIRDLNFCAADAGAIAARFAAEGRGLYAKVHAVTLTDQRATHGAIVNALDALKTEVSPARSDTVVVFLSAHGLTTDAGYYCADYDLDLADVAGTALSARELADALGKDLPAKNVFLFVDTCHAGALGGSNDELENELGGGLYVMASSSGSQSSYEDAAWGHGAFTKALLDTLSDPDNAVGNGGTVPYDVLESSVKVDVARLLRADHQNPADQQPVVPLAPLVDPPPVASIP